jgi:4-alpha-glucanotransferase
MSETPPGRFSSGRHAGILVPLFSIPSRRSWGIGEIPDLISLAAWMQSAGLDFVQLLPVNEMQEGQSSPYSALSAMAIDPIFIALDEIEEWSVVEADDALGKEARAALSRARQSKSVDYAAVRAAKTQALRQAFAWFSAHRKGPDDHRIRAFESFQERERWWLEDYAIFRALHDAHGGRHWREWEAGVRDRDAAALSAARERFAEPIRYYTYLQWIADEQWQRARIAAAPVGIFGDFPFMVSGHSADVWSRQHEFDLDASVGTPPDAFSASGQDWGLPAYRWDVIREGDYAWLRDRTRRSATLFDGFRVDHLIGFYRTFVRRTDGSKGFIPPHELEQRAQGEYLLTLFADGGATIIGEDLGTVPDFMRESLAQRSIPGMKVLRWERNWHGEGQPFLDVRDYRPTSVATSGTHDTETNAEWWDTAELSEREAVLALPTLHAAALDPRAPFSDRVRDALLETLFAAGSNLLILPMQDIFGWRDRINVPGSVNDQNWTWRLPHPVEDLQDAPESRERAAFLHRLAAEWRRINTTL